MDSHEVEPRMLIHRGAEADLYLGQVGPWKAVIKKRVPKKYRQYDLDRRIRRDRTIREASVISEARKSGVRTPTLLSLDLDECSMTLLFIPGILARDGLDMMKAAERSALFKELGCQVGLLHRQGIAHGDLTTSNIIVSTVGQPFLLDFGLASHSVAAEDRAVDLHLLKRSATISHVSRMTDCFRAFGKGYSSTLGREEAEQTERKAVEIARRGRYFAIR